MIPDLLLLLAAVAPLGAPAAAPATQTVPPGKQLTGRQSVLEASIPGTPDQVYRLWTTPEGVKCFLASDTRIDLKPGGRYEMIFDPASDPEGAVEGTKGARLLEFTPGKSLTFEWAMPSFAKELNTTPLPTWVEVTFAPDPQPRMTRMRLAHRGFGMDPSWDRAYAHYRGSASAWRRVLEKLVGCAAGGSKPAGSDSETVRGRTSGCGRLIEDARDPELTP